MLSDTYEQRIHYTSFASATSDGTREGMNLKQGGLCAKENRRVQAVVVNKRKIAPAIVADVSTIMEGERHMSSPLYLFRLTLHMLSGINYSDSSCITHAMV